MAHFPINLDLTKKKCVVVGGGPVAERKVEHLLEFGASVTVISPRLTPRLSEMSKKRKITHIASRYEPGHICGAVLVVAATDSLETNIAVAEEANFMGMLVNVVDDPALSSFFFPSVVRRGDFVLSISTSGKSPALAKWVREKLEKEFGGEFGELADLLGEIREEVKKKYPDLKDRVSAYERILGSEALSLLANGRRYDALEVARKCI